MRRAARTWGLAAQASFLPALAGWLLGYPTVYWPRTQRTAAAVVGNCLAQVPLRVTSVLYRSPAGTEHVVQQYSVPADLGDTEPDPEPPDAEGWRLVGIRRSLVTLTAVAL